MTRVFEDMITVPNALEESRIYRGLRRLGTTLREAPQSSRVAGLLTWFGRATRESWLYRWLTKEPEPEVIVIDLRETWTVGPFIALLDWAIGGLSSTYENSLTEQFVSGVARRLYRAPIRYISLMFLGFLIPAAGVLIITGEQYRVSILGLSILVIVALLGLFIDLSWPTIRQSKPIQLLITALEPPDPPERNG